MLKVSHTSDALEKSTSRTARLPNSTIAVLLPCYNEEAAIEKVVREFEKYLPTAEIYVYDNNSTDRTRKVAKEAGAIVRTERLQGKGNVVRRMFADIDADIYLLADGDRTYDASAASTMIDLMVTEKPDMIVGTRLGGGEAYRRDHQFGNRLFNRIVRYPTFPGCLH